MIKNPMEEVMKKLTIAAVVHLGLMLGVSMPAAAAPPACVSTLLSGLGACLQCPTPSPNNRAMQMVIHRKDNAWVSYSAGWFCKNGSGNADTSNMFQQFSNRFSGGQNFTVTSKDVHRVVIGATDGQITVTNLTWNFTTTLTNTSCSGNVITASNNGEFYLISFGGLQTFNCL